jgi:putative nucleotidyltransferase with HDIG domain
MSEKPDRQKAEELFCRHLAADNLKKHCLATEAILRELAPRFGGDPDVWGVAGLLHDLDYDQTKDDMPRHTLVTAEILREEGFDEGIIRAIMAHNAAHVGVEMEAPLDYLLAASESLTGMIVAMALILPDKKLAGVKTKSIMKRMKEKAFARNVNREDIMLCREVGLEPDEFVTIGIQAMQKISDELGL